MTEMQKQKAKLKHILREGNQIADYLANLTINQTNKQEFNGFTNLPTTDKRIINMDKSQTLSIRIRNKQIRHHKDPRSDI
ncbi:hypothetical protein MTR67_038634 [Solanum verrucosum]|uniref:Uncharacterized protein n=1 Tax=Solanum verrucosum TaxID=315347 RepID=A0AAF0UG62_SOLVR|nr:hypothetical protein MTR67_038634 [Solanum verrucosum]